MAEFLKIQYKLNKISKDRLLSLVGNKITQAEYEYITGEELAK